MAKKAKVFEYNGNETGTKEVTGYAKKDIIQISGVSQSQLSYEKVDKDLVIRVNNGATINVVNYFGVKAKKKIDTIRVIGSNGSSEDIKISLNADIHYSSTDINETFNFGKGVGTITFDSTQGFGQDKIILNKGERVNLNFTGNPQLTYEIKGKDVIITSKTGKGGSVILKGYAAKDKGATVNIDGVLNLSNVYFKATEKKNVFKGTRLNESVTSTADNDTFKLGAGNDKITFNSSGFGTDTIVLSKGETVDLELSVSGLKYEIKGKDLVLTSQVGKGGTIILKNYAAKDLGAKVLLNGVDISTQKGLKDLLNFGVSDIDKKGKLTTTALNDVINASGYIATSAKGVIINAGAGNDKITGSKFNDTITAISGNNEIYESSGINKITTGKGDDKFNLSGNSSNTIKSSGGNNVVEIRNTGTNKITLGAGYDKINIYDGVNTVNAGNSGLSKDILVTGGGRICNEFWVAGGVNTLTSGKGMDFYEIYDGYNTINSGADIDTFELKGGVNNINAGAGDDAISIYSGINIVQGGAGNDAYHITKRSNEVIPTPGPTVINDSKGNEIYNILLENVDVNITDKAGNDDYYVKYLNSNVTITDSKGNDSLSVNHDVGNMVLFFNVDAKKGAVGDLKIVADDYEPYDFDIDEVSGINIVNYFKKSNKIETFNAQFQQGFSDTERHSIDLDLWTDYITSEVQSWLKENNYKDAMSVFDGNDSSKIESLLSVYSGSRYEKVAIDVGNFDDNFGDS